MSKCSPKRIQELNSLGKFNSQSCYLDNELLDIATAYNKNVSKKGYICAKNSKTCVKSTPINLNDDLYNQLSKYLNPLVKSEENWLSLDFIQNIKDRNVKDSLLYFTFKPKGPEHSKDWLTTNNINEVIQQYTDLYTLQNFLFLGAQPSDYSKITKVNWPKIKSSKHVGIIFNKDSHNQPGTHWVSVFIDNVNKTVDYFDSLGESPNKNICSFLKNFNLKTYKYNFNKIVHQKGGSQCGVYACFFLKKRLEGTTMEYINKQIVSDKMMIDYRKEIFR